MKKLLVFLVMVFASVAFGQTNIYSYLSGNFSYGSKPPNPSAFGKLWFNSVTNHFYFWNSSSVWQPLLDSTNALATPVTVANGGTGVGTATLNGVVYGNGTSALGITAAGTTGQVLTATTGAAPTWQAAVGGGGLAVPVIYQSGKLYTTNFAPEGTGSGLHNSAAFKIIYLPIYITKTVVISGMQVKVLTTSATDSVGMAIYNDNGSWVPGTLQKFCGDSTTVNTGDKFVAFSTPDTLTQGWYWMAVNTKQTNVGLDYWNIINESIENTMLAILAGYSNGSQAGGVDTYTSTGTTMTFPATAASPTLGTWNGVVPCTYVKIQ